jgi:hypothetical protein
MEFKYILRHNLLKKPIFIKDLDNWCSYPPRNLSDAECLRHLHLKFSEEKIFSSKGLKDAINAGWFIKVDCTEKEEKIEYNSNGDSKSSEDISEIKSQINQLSELMSTFISSGIANNNTSVKNSDNEILKKIYDDLKLLKKKSLGEELTGYSELTPEIAAMNARRNVKTEIKNIENLKTEEKNVEIDIDDIISNLEDL